MPRHRRRYVLLPFAALVATSLALAGCGSDDGTADAADSQADTWDVVAAFYPLQFVAERVGGDVVTVTNLTKPGAEPHDLELAPQDLGTLTDADLAIYLPEFQPAVDEAIATASDIEVLDVSESADLSLTYVPGEAEEEHAEEEEGEAHSDEPLTDPHFWLDPMRLADVADDVALELSMLDPVAETTFQQNAAALRKELEALDRSFAKGLASCENRLLVTSHTAFGYLADAYDLEQVGLTGLTPETEPNPQDLAEITDIVRDNDVQTVFSETLVSPEVAETVASATGAATAVLDPLEGLSETSAGEDYLQVMDANLQTLRTGLPCR
jgi:zinc transport system substrate-binding protein